MIAITSRADTIRAAGLGIVVAGEQHLRRQTDWHGALRNSKPRRRHRRGAGRGAHGRPHIGCGVAGGKPRLRDLSRPRAAIDFARKDLRSRYGAPFKASSSISSSILLAAPTSKLISDLSPRRKASRHRVQGRCDPFPARHLASLRAPCSSVSTSGTSSPHDPPMTRWRSACPRRSRTATTRGRSRLACAFGNSRQALEAAVDQRIRGKLVVRASG